MMNFFEHCADIASVGIIVDFTEDTKHVLSALLQILRLGIQRLSPKSSERTYAAQQQTWQSRQGYKPPYESKA